MPALGSCRSGSVDRPRPGRGSRRRRLAAPVGRTAASPASARSAWWRQAKWCTAPPAVGCVAAAGVWLLGAGLPAVRQSASRVLAAIHGPAAIARVLGALGLPGSGSGQAGCRVPSGREGGGPGGESGWPE